ncbi:MAG: nucleotidyl transferase AbiEii/AbiGii toxin family protein [Anaerolineae bacterium]|nr:nucleotidyl transferase AbiEii/AbiGii toxin family protein [Anaerolineae bacterium]
MRYTSGRAFRQALESRLQGLAHTENIPLVRLRKQISFERFIARLQSVHPDTWILKGGLAMQLRLGTQSRTTKDVDLLNNELSGDIYASLVEAASLNMGDWFAFEVGQEDKAPQDAFGGHRYHVRCLLDGRVFEAFHVDVGVGDLLVDNFDYLHFAALLDFADIASIEVPCYPITQQIAEKLHALTRQYESGGSTRVKDFVDILLLAGLADIEGTMLSEAIRSPFEVRKTHPLPQEMPALSKTIRREYTRLAKELDLSFAKFDAAEKALAEFVNPVFSSNTLGIWEANNWRWREPE